MIYMLYVDIADKMINIGEVQDENSQSQLIVYVQLKQESVEF
jgi:hypothetical protein